jgi:hypothetical protein
MIALLVYENDQHHQNYAPSARWPVVSGYEGEAATAAVTRRGS